MKSKRSSRRQVSNSLTVSLPVNINDGVQMQMQSLYNLHVLLQGAAAEAVNLMATTLDKCKVKRDTTRIKVHDPIN